MSVDKHFYNTLGQEIEFLPISDFLREYPNYLEHLVQIIQIGANPISAPVIQRRCLVRYTVAQGMMEALLKAKIAVKDELCIDKNEVIKLSSYLINDFKAVSDTITKTK